MNTLTNTRAAATPVQPFVFQTLQELYDEPVVNIQYLIEGLLPTAGTSVLMAKPKTGKTVLTRQIAASVIRGDELLGRKCEQGGVLYFACEEKKSEVVRHLRELGLRQSDPLYLRCGAIPNKHEAVRQLEASIKEHSEVRLVIIDTLFRFLSFSDGNDYVAVNNAMEYLGELARNSGVHILVVHHMKKRQTDDRQDSSLGSTAITGGVDSILYLIADRAGIRSFSTQQRYGVEMPETQLNWNPDTRSVTKGVACVEVSRRLKEETSSRIQTDVIQFVSEHPACALAEILKAVTGKGEQKLAIIRTLEKDILLRSGEGQKGEPFTYTVREVPMDVVA